MPLPHATEIRTKAEYLKDKAVFEVDLVSGEIRWLNSYALDVLGYDKNQITKMKLEDITPEEMREALHEEMADKSQGKEPKFSIWPAKHVDGKLVWFYVYQTKTDHPIHWMQAEIVKTTEMSGPSYVFMRMQMDVASQFVYQESKINNLDEFVKGEFKKVYDKHEHYDKLLEDLVVRIERVGQSAERAADAAISAATRMESTEVFVRTNTESFKTTLEESTKAQTEQILNIIKQEDIIQRGLEEFKRSVNSTTEQAIKSIIGRAEQAGHDLSKKVTVPIAALVVVIMLLQYLMGR